MALPVGGVVAAGHPTTAAAAAEILQAGGNAFDAAVAGVLVACIAESVLTSVAGGGFLLAHTSQGEGILFDFFSQTPRQKLPQRVVDFYPIQANFGDVIQEFHIGLGSMAVPGTWAGLMHVHRRLGRLPLAVVIEPALVQARQGVRVNEFFAYVYDLLNPILTATPAARAIYAPQGRLLKLGDTLRMPDFANALEDLVTTGPDGFYQGAIATQLIKDCTEQGGYLTLDDLRHYQVIERRPLAVNYRGVTLLTNPPPSSGGTLIAFALELLAKFDLTSMGYGSPEHLHSLSQAMRYTNEARRHGYDARLYDPQVAEKFLAPDHLDHYRQAMSSVVNKWGSTTHLSVMDHEGNAASVTTSNGEGSSYVIPGTNMMVNNMLGEEDLNPHGFHQWQENQRISSMMAPTIILQDGQPRLVLGSGGSNRIRTAILQVISNITDFAMEPEAAVRASRIHWENEMFHLEPGFDQGTLEQHPMFETAQPIWWQQQNMFFGGVHTVGLGSDGHLHGAGDNRRSGAVAFSA